MPSPFVDTRGNLLNCHVHSPIIPRCAHPDTFISAFYMSAELFISSAVVICRRSFVQRWNAASVILVGILQPHTGAQDPLEFSDWRIRFCSSGIFWMFLLFPFIWDLDAKFSFVCCFAEQISRRLLEECKLHRRSNWTVCSRAEFDYGRTGCAEIKSNISF